VWTTGAGIKRLTGLPLLTCQSDVPSILLGGVQAFFEAYVVTPEEATDRSFRHLQPMGLQHAMYDLRQRQIRFLAIELQQPACGSSGERLLPPRGNAN
jgi:hypothetical protein